MKIIKTYESYNLDDLDLGRFEEKIDKSKLTLNEDGSYDYDGGIVIVLMKLKSLTELPIRLRTVSGFFNCAHNDLISLEGAPKKVGGGFGCVGNKLISLQYAPLEIGGIFDCTDNNLISLQYLPKVGGEIKCGNNLLLSNENTSNIKIKKGYGENKIYIGDVIETVKAMTFEQQMKELDFFEKYDRNAFEMLKEVFDKMKINYGPETRSMVGVMKGYTNAKEMF